MNRLVESFLASHEVDRATTDKLRYQLVHARNVFGDRPINTLTPYELDAWRSDLPARTRQHYFRAFRQILEQGVTWRLLERNPSDGIKNRKAYGHLVPDSDDYLRGLLDEYDASFWARCRHGQPLTTLVQAVVPNVSGVRNFRLEPARLGGSCAYSVPKRF